MIEFSSHHPIVFPGSRAQRDNKQLPSEQKTAFVDISSSDRAGWSVGKVRHARDAADMDKGSAESGLSIPVFPLLYACVWKKASCVKKGLAS